MARTPVRPAVLRVHLLGEFRIESAGHLVALPTRRMQSLVAYLALHPEPISRDILAFVIWPNSSIEQARNSLRNALPAVRRRLGDPFLIIDRDSVSVTPTVWVDARLFETGAENLLRAPAPGLDDFQSQLYGGDLLSDFSDAWIVPEREHYRRLYLDSLLRLVQVARAQSEYPRAIEFAQLVLANDPSNETAYQHLMFAHMALGDREEAIAQYEACHRALLSELDVEPMPETTALYEWICQCSPDERNVAAGLTNLPIPSSRFIGRRRETAAVKSTLSERRLVTLTGAGGSGKTRLAIQVATDLLDRYHDGVWWVELGSLRDATLVPQVVAKALGVRETGSEPLSETISHWIGARQMLLVLDNCEHLVSACALHVDKWLCVCPGLTVLATSRERLGIYGEAAFLVPPLAVPDGNATVDCLQECESVRLFVERAQAARSDFSLTGQNASAVTQIVRRLDGIPLALELAASRVSSLPVSEIADHLGDRFNWPADNRSDARQQTLRALIDWSHALLAPEESTLFRRLAVFHGSVTLDAIERVCSDGDIRTDQILDLVTRLISKSLLVPRDQCGIAAYRMLDIIREYAADKLDTAGEAARLRSRHLVYYLALSQTADQQLRGDGQLEWSKRIEVDHDNFRAALEWSRRRRGTDRDETTLQLASSLFRFWSMRGYWSEGRAWLRLARKIGGVSRARAGALLALAELTIRQDGATAAYSFYADALAVFRELGDRWSVSLTLSYWLFAEFDPAKAEASFSASLTIARELKDDWLMANAYHRMGICAFRQGQLAQARAVTEQALAHARRAGDRWLISSALVNLGEVQRALKDYAQAERLYRQGLAIEQELGDMGDSAICLHNLAYIALVQREFARAETFFIDSLKLHLAGGNRHGVAECLVGLATVAAECRQDGRAVRLWAFADRVLKELGQMMEPTDQVEFERNVARVRARMGEAAFKTAQNDGRAMTRDQAVVLALDSGS